MDMLRQRRFLGIMGMLLPVLVVISRAITFGDLSSLESISSCHYYKDYLLFEGLMIAVGVFLLYYKGYDIKDYWLSTAAGICAILTAFTPCNPTALATLPEALIRRNIFNIPQPVTAMMHNIGALGFFGLLIYIIVAQFTKTGGNMTKEKRIRNIIYRICGYSMIVTILGGGIVNFFGWWKPALFLGEALALELFGIAWVIKGEILLKDKKKE